MSEVQTAEGLLEIFSAPEKLQGYMYRKEERSEIDQRKFHLNLPFEEIKAKVEAERNLLLSKLTEEEKSQV